MSHDDLTIPQCKNLKLDNGLRYLSGHVIEIMAKQGIDGDVVAKVARQLIVLPTVTDAESVVQTLGEQNETAYKVLMLLTRVQFENVPILGVYAKHGVTYYEKMHAFDINCVLVAFAFDHYLSRYDGWGVA